MGERSGLADIGTPTPLGESVGSALGGSFESSRFVLETDQASEFWQFLNGLRGDDLLIELIVNDLDARSARTEVRFEPDRLICVGEGDPVDADGWARLRKMKGAGHVVQAKQGLFDSLLCLRDVLFASCGPSRASHRSPGLKVGFARSCTFGACTRRLAPTSRCLLSPVWQPPSGHWKIQRQRSSAS